MKEIKAYVRTETLEKTVEALEAAGAPGIMFSVFTKKFMP